MSFTSPYNSTSEIRRRAAIVGNFNISTASVASKVTIADAMVNGFVARTYSLPLSSTCSVVKELAGEIAEALILKEQYGPEANDTDKDGQAKFESAISILKMIADKEIELFPDSAPGTEFSRNTSAFPRAFPNKTSDALTSTLSTAPQNRMSSIY